MEMHQIRYFLAAAHAMLAEVIDRAEAAQNGAETLRLLNQPPVRVGVTPTLTVLRAAVSLSAR